MLRGFPVTLDGRTLSHDLEAFLHGSSARLERGTSHELRLLPAGSYGFVPGPRVVVPLFDVDVSGAVRPTETATRCGAVRTSADGTPVVTIRGFKVAIDGQALTTDLVAGAATVCSVVIAAFPSYQRAEELTEYNLNQNKAAIEAWIEGPSPPADGGRGVAES